MENKKTILVVDDEEDIRDALKDKLESGGLQVLTAEDGQKGLAIALAKHPDLILLDILMPEKNGWEVLGELRKDPWGKDALVILLTVLDDATSTSQALQYDVYDILVKNNWAIADVVKRIKERLNITD